MRTVIMIGRKDLLLAKISNAKQRELQKIYERSDAVNGGNVMVTVENIKKPRTTGKHSQNRCINGYIQQICTEMGYDFADVKMAMKEEAISRGYPFMRDDDGNIVYSIRTGEPMPASETVISTVEAGYLIETIQQFAAEQGIILRED